MTESIRLSRRQAASLERLQLKLRRLLDPAGLEAERRAQREERERDRRRRQIAAADRRRRRELARRQRQEQLLARPRCQHCGRALRSNAAPDTRFCSSCRVLKEPCPDCGEPKRLDAERCHACLLRARRPERTNSGMCRGYWVHVGGENSLRFSVTREQCSVSWGNQDHVHCACGRACAAYVNTCSQCVRLQLADANQSFCPRCGLEVEVFGLCGVCVAEIGHRVLRATEPEWLEVPIGRMPVLYSERPLEDVLDLARLRAVG